MQRVRALLESEMFVPVCLVLALALRLVAVALYPVAPMSDFKWYFDRATDIAAGRGVVFHGVPTAYWPIGYPFFLAAIFFVTGPSVLAAQLANVVLATGSLVLAHRLALRLSGSRLAAGIALAILAFYPNQIAYVALVANESLVTFLLLAGIALLLRANDGRGRWLLFAAAGAIFGVACLTKPQTAVIPTVVIAWMAWRARPPARTLAWRLLVVNAALAVVILPWTIRNHQVFGHTVFIANSGGVNLYLGNNPDANGAYPPAEVEPKIAAAIHAGGGNEYEIDRRAGRMALAYAAQHPLQELVLVPKKIWNLYAKDADGLSWLEESEHAIGKLAHWKVLAQLYYVGLGALFVAAVVRSRRGGAGTPRPDGLPLVIIAVFTAIYCVYFGQSRFHYPLMPWIAIYSGTFVAGLLRANVVAAEPSGSSVVAPA